MKKAGGIKDCGKEGKKVINIEDNHLLFHATYMRKLAVQGHARLIRNYLPLAVKEWI